MITVRTFTNQDLPAITSIYNQHIADGNSTFDGFPYSVEKMQSIVENLNDREIYLVAEKEDQVVGWGSIKGSIPFLH